MTAKEKSDILTLREEGRTISQIAEELHIPFNTVKSYLYRHSKPIPEKKMKAAESAPEHFEDKNLKSCLYCGKPVLQDPHRKEKKFCCASCRIRWWNHNSSQSKGKAVSEKKCAACGQTFRAYGSRKYCSHTCYIADRFGSERCGKENA